MWNNDQGEFVREVSQFHQSTLFSEADRYHLYISWACPWAHRTAIVRSMLGLEDAISLSVVDPVWNDNGWTFTQERDCIADFVNHKRDLIEIYRMVNPSYQGEETTPVLWDKKIRTIVNNESLEIIKMFAVQLKDLAVRKIDLYPEDERAKIDQVIARIYPTINNGVYRAGFATHQKMYERAYHTLFNELDYWENELGKRRFLCGEHLSLADICMFTTLFRFDLVYYGHFKCNQKHLYEYPNLWGFVRDLYQTPGIAQTCFPEHIKRHYYMSQTPINPNRIVPMGPLVDFHLPHGRDRF